LDSMRENTPDSYYCCYSTTKPTLYPQADSPKLVMGQNDYRLTGR
jgi:hypothetical protein